jgi:hypothetical protein
VDENVSTKSTECLALVVDFFFFFLDAGCGICGYLF